MKILAGLMLAYVGYFWAMQRSTKEKYVMTSKLSSIKLDDKSMHLYLAFGYLSGAELDSCKGVYVYVSKPGNKNAIERMHTLALSESEIQSALQVLCESGPRKFFFNKISFELDCQPAQLIVSFPGLLLRSKFKFSDSAEFQSELIESLGLLAQETAVEYRN